MSEQSILTDGLGGLDELGECTDIPVDVWVDGQTGEMYE